MYQDVVEEDALIFQLVGTPLADGWTVEKRVDRSVNQTGSHFSIGYIAVHESGQRAFLKAIDYRRAFHAADTSAALEQLTRTFNFEPEVLSLCAGAKMSRVVVAISHGEIPAKYPELPIPYLIFELADGDVRRHVDASHALEFVWSARALHHIAVALKQLHNKGISHQDVKPSNVLVFPSAGSKLADLGRANCTTLAAPHDHFILPGGRHYAPPEQLFHFEIGDRLAYRRAGDLYLFGSMIHFFVTGQPLTPVVLSMMRPEHRPGTWTGTFQDVLPYWRDAHASVVHDCHRTLGRQLGPGNNTLTLQTIRLLEYATEPDLTLRGYPTKRQANANQYDLQQFISGLNLVASRLEYQNLGKNAARAGKQAS